MSYLPINEENKEAPVGQTTNAPGAETPPQTSGSAGGAPEAPKGSSSGSPTQFGSSASKLADYLSANEPQITEQAAKVAGNLNQQYGDVSQGITNAANQFGQQVQGGYAPLNQDLIGQAMQNPAGFAATPENVQAFQKQYNDAYSGPLTFEGTSPYSDIQNQVGQAIQQGNLLSTQAGLQQYLQGQGNNPNRASATLDTLLLQGNPDAQATIRNAASKLGTLGGQLQTATTGANQSVLDAQQAAQQAAAYARGQFDPYAQNFGTQLSTAAANAEAQRNAYNAQQQKAYNDLTPLNSYLTNFTSGTGYDIENPFSSALAYKPVVNPITPQNYATPEQYAQAQAIQQLLGGTAQLPISPETLSQAGTAQAIPAGSFYDPGNLQNMVNAIANKAALSTYNQYEPVYAAAYNTPGYRGPGYIPPQTVSEAAQRLSLYPNGGASQQPNLMAFEKLLSELAPYSGGNIYSGINGPNFYGIGPQTGEPPLQSTNPPPQSDSGGRHYY